MKIRTPLTRLQPSQLYINRTKLRKLIMDGFTGDDLINDPLKVIKLNGELVLIKDHTKAFLAYQQGIQTIEVEYYPEVSDLYIYKKCVEWCKEEGITSVSDLGKQILPDEDFEREWQLRIDTYKRLPDD
ncbi:hypothetical protein K8O68_05730 [Salipaludibacillus sp. CUR1]|uniref:hypothetical protein n=1 Tax=Salipaludibacillus sp. CUR1 TaxID=2820003 RepID=UPI001E458915|nr:hypothetical protein [Salipaludibacillus sp. CUR1]MCE7791918.1 hypothetical protein [Salipaludibacillus sp. CUR1]